MCAIANEKELQELIVKYSDKLARKFAGKDGKKHLVVCGGTGCLSSNSHEILVRLQELIKEKGLEDKAEVNVVGCFGFCSQGPFVKIFPDDRLYRMVKESDAERIIEEDIIGGKCIEDLLYEDPAFQRTPSPDTAAWQPCFRVRKRASTLSIRHRGTS